MDASAITTYLADKKQEYSRLQSHQLVQHLHYKEYVEIETKKDELFKKKIEFISMAKSLREAMVRDTGYRQLKRYFVEMIGMADEDAKHAADKYNEGSRIYDKFPKILQNLSNCPALDIRDLTIHELSLAGSQNWVIRRTALSKSKKKPANGTVPAPIDWNDVQLRVDDIVARNWFDDAKDNPSLVAYIMDKINERVVGKTLY